MLANYPAVEKAPNGRAAVSLPNGGKSKKETLKAAGISTSTVNRDLKPVPTGTPEGEKTEENSDIEDDPVPNGTPIDTVAAAVVVAVASSLLALRYCLTPDSVQLFLAAVPA